MSRYDHNLIPNLPARIVDMANADIVGYHAGKKAFDFVFANTVADALERVHLEQLKMRQPNCRVSDKSWRFGFVPKDCREFDDNLDAERLLVERNTLRSAGKFQEADAIRERLDSWGYEITDEAGGTNWIVII